MLNSLPFFVTIIFIATVLLTFFLFSKATDNNKTVAITSAGWLLLNAALALGGYYKNTSTTPPHFFLAIMPPLVVMVLVFTTRKGKQLVSDTDIRMLTLLSVVRIPVEIVLYWLFLNKAVPELMTFAGRNFDIISGLTSPVVYFLCFKGKVVRNKKILLVWNFISLLLLLNIVINAVFSAPFSFQQFAFDQPNIAVLYFPFVWLPCYIVMVVLFSHLVSIKKLTSI